MPRSIYWKLTLAFMLVALITAALVAVFIRATSTNRLYQFVLDQQRDQMEEVLASYYAGTGSWEGIGRFWDEILPAGGMGAGMGEERRPMMGNPGHGGQRQLFGLASADGQVIIPARPNQHPGQHLTAQELRSGTPLWVDGDQVGILLVVQDLPVLTAAETLFLNRTNQALLFAFFAALLIAAVLGILLARTFTRPIQQLTEAAQNIAGGSLAQQVEIHSNDEIGRLAAAFNQMSQEVARVNQLRRQMTADIAHDLRTPLTVVAGYLESMRDGVLQPTPERISLIYTEIERLQNLVGDLRMLSQADAGELRLTPQPIQPADLLERAAELYGHHAERQNVTLAVAAPASLPPIRVDEARMMQVFDNLLSNAMRYTPAGGSITLAARAVGGGVEIQVRDTGTGIPPEELPHIFDRFHRVDKSRHTESGESGLGLAIVKTLVEAQSGRVWAESTHGQGTTVFLQFPA